MKSAEENNLIKDICRLIRRHKTWRVVFPTCGSLSPTCGLIRKRVDSININDVICFAGVSQTSRRIRRSRSWNSTRDGGWRSEKERQTVDWSLIGTGAWVARECIFSCFAKIRYALDQFDTLDVVHYIKLMYHAIVELKLTATTMRIKSTAEMKIVSR